MATSRAADPHDAGSWDAEARAALKCELTEIQPLSGGCVAEVYRLKLSDGQNIVAKVSRNAHSQLPIEAGMLRYLTEHTELPVPAVFYDSPTLLLMSLVRGESRFSAGAQVAAAELLAALHYYTAAAYGFGQDTLIGGLPQANPWTAHWTEFFAQHRLRAMAREGFRAGRLPQDLLRRIESLADQVDRWIEEPERPALIHGDVWTTNVLADGDRITGFIDPAIYYAHEEIELAFVTLFDTFGEPFFERYQSLRPIRSGFFEVRRHIYNLYPLLVHARLFGGGYIGSIERIVQQFGY